MEHKIPVYFNVRTQIHVGTIHTSPSLYTTINCSKKLSQEILKFQFNTAGVLIEYMYYHSTSSLQNLVPSKSSPNMVYHNTTQNIITLLSIFFGGKSDPWLTSFLQCPQLYSWDRFPSLQLLTGSDLKVNKIKFLIISQLWMSLNGNQ